MVNILLTNDDGIYSKGIEILYEIIKNFGNVLIVVPEKERSATGFSITLHKPIRLRKVKYSNTDAYIVSGYPSDVVILTLLELKHDVDLVVSGINLSENTSLQAILASGTLSSCFYANMFNIPAIAFSINENNSKLGNNTTYLTVLEHVVSEIVKFVIDKLSLFKGITINVNFPKKITNKSKIVLVKPCFKKFKHGVLKRYDPVGKEYYWIYGNLMIDQCPEDTDTYQLYIENNITVTLLDLKILCFENNVFTRLKKLNNIIKEELLSKLNNVISQVVQKF